LKTFASLFGFFFGLVIVLHGIALAIFQSPLIATSKRWGYMLYFYGIAALTSKGPRRERA
jgi:hypothetical protein